MTQDIYFLDANIAIYAAGSPSEYQQPAQRLLQAVADGGLTAVTSVTALQEVLHVCLRRRRPEAGAALVGALLRAMPVLDLRSEDAAEMIRLVEQSPGLGAHDALHVAVMRRHGLTHIITADRHFSGLPGITALDPVEAVALLD